LHRYKILAAAVFIELLIGFQYTWPIFDRILQDQYGLKAGQTQSVFSVAVVSFAISFTIVGRLINRIGPRVTSIIGAVVYGTGLVVAGLGGAKESTLLLGTGVLLGVGIAFGYIGPIITAVKWFPEHKGVVTGLVIGAFGSGAFFLGGVIRILLGFGLTIFHIFAVLGLTGLFGVILLSFWMKEPVEVDAEVIERKGRLPKGLLSSGHFWALVAAFFTGTFAGLTIVGSLEMIGQTLGAPEPWLKACVLVFGIGNAAGRAGWGALIELAGARRAVTAALGLQTVFIVVLIFAGHIGPVFAALAFLIGFNYGGNFVLYVTEVAHTYGADRVGTVYGLIYVIYVASGLTGPGAAGFSRDHWGGYVPAMALAAAVALAGAAAFVALYRRPERAGL